MEPVLANIEARCLHNERYGQSYRTAESFIQKLIYVHQMRAESLPSCSNTLREIGYISILNNSGNLESK